MVENSETPQIEFRGGKIVSAVPIVFFIVWAIVFSLMGLGNERVFIIGMIIGMIIGLFLCKSRWSGYADVIFEGMSQKIAIIAILAYFWAGMFANLLETGGFVDSLIWVGLKSHVSGGIFVGLTFILGALFATAVGTAYGTISAFLVLMFPAGVALGADPLMLVGAIISGGIFGDNLAPISDTTIISASTQETDIPGVVRSRFKYAIAAAIPALVLFTTLGGLNAEKEGTQTLTELQSQVDPQGLIFLIPFAVVLFLAFRGHHILTSLTWGILTAFVLNMVMGTSFTEVISIDMESGEMGGALIEGISGYFELSIMLLFILGGAYIIQASGLMQAIIEWFKRVVRGSIKKAEFFMWAISVVSPALITHNAAAGLTVAPFINDVGKSYNVHPYRRANVLDAPVSSVAGIIPWGGHVLLAVSTVATVAGKYDFISTINPTQVVPFIFHGWLLPIVMLIAVLTGWGLRYMGKKGEEVKPGEKDQ